MKAWRGVLVLPVAFGLILSTACVTKKVFRSTVQEQDQKIDTVQGGVEVNERRIKEVDDKTRTEVGRLDAKADAARTRGDEAFQKAAQAEKVAKGKVLWEVTLANDEVKFGLNQAKISDTARSVLDDLAGRVKGFDHAVYVEIQGHTDNTGGADHNKILSEQRAGAVKDWLSAHGVSPDRIVARGFGQEKPLVPNVTTGNRARNRRVQFIILERDSAPPL